MNVLKQLRLKTRSDRVPFRNQCLAIALLAGISFAPDAGAKKPAPPPPVKKNPAPLAPTVVDEKDACAKTPPSGKAKITLLAKGREAFVGKLEMPAFGKVPEHRDATEETIYILKGHGMMFIDDVAYKVSAGTTVFMPANAKVRFENGDVPLEAIQVFAGPGPAAKYDYWTPNAHCKASK